MRPLFVLLIGGLALAEGGSLASNGARGDTCALQLRKLDASSRAAESDYLYRGTNPQSFFRRFTDNAAAGQNRTESPDQEAQEAAFARIVKKEPAKYACKHRFRGVVRLGSQDFAFMLDSARAESDADKPTPRMPERKPVEEEAKPHAKPSPGDSVSGLQTLTSKTRARGVPRNAIAYDRLYFDFNHNGDLTDDRVIEVQRSPETVYSGQYEYRKFPRIDVTIDCDGTQVDYAFTLVTTAHMLSRGYVYAFASFHAAVYREGEIILKGTKRRIVLVDSNSNGRFDDKVKISHEPTGDSEIHPAVGDILMLAPSPGEPSHLDRYDVTAAANRHYLSTLLNVDGVFYDVKVSASGDRLSLTTYTGSVGYVTNPNDGFCAVVYGDKGFVTIRGGRSTPVPLPEGDWNLLSYTIEPIRAARVLGRATKDSKAVQVREGHTVALPFGPPYKPVVRVMDSQGGVAQLELSLLGCGGDKCMELRVDGERPPNPQFTIANPWGGIVHRGRFEYG